MIICIVASFISNFGLNLQKLALTKKQNGTCSKAAYRWIWFFGTYPLPVAAICTVRWCRREAGAPVPASANASVWVGTTHCGVCLLLFQPALLVFSFSGTCDAPGFIGIFGGAVGDFAALAFGGMCVLLSPLRRRRGVATWWRQQ